MTYPKYYSHEAKPGGLGVWIWSYGEERQSALESPFVLIHICMFVFMHAESHHISLLSRFILFIVKIGLATSGYSATDPKPRDHDGAAK